MSLLTELQSSKTHQINIVIELDGVNYSKYQPDSGLTVDSENIGLIKSFSISPSKIDIRRANQTVASASFTMLDKDGLISSRIGASDSALIGTNCNVYIGVMTGSFDFTDYELVAQNTVKSINKSGADYKFNTKEPTSLLKAPIYTDFTQLTNSINDTDTTIDVDDTSIFPSSGKAQIDSEVIDYTSKNSTSLLGVTRADLSSEADGHSAGADIFPITTLTQNPMDLIPFLITDSTTLNLSSSLVDTAAFAALKASTFSGETYDFDVTQIDDVLEFIEDEILAPTGTRLVSKDRST